MALTIQSQPEEFQPIWHPVMFLMSSTLSGEDSFRYSYRVTVGSSTRTIKVSPRPNDSYGELDVSTHLQDYLDAEDITLPTADNFTTAPHVEYVVEVTEEYLNTSGVLTTGATETFTTKYATDILLSRVEYLTFDEALYHTDYDGVGATALLMFNTRENDVAYKDDYYYIHAPGLNDDESLKAYIREYDNTGAQLTVTTIAGVPALDGEPARYLKLDMSTISFLAETVQIGIQFANLSGNVLTVNKKFKLEDEPCTSFTDYRFLYKDRYGSLNMLRLNKGSSQNVSVKPKTYRKRQDPFNQSDVSRGTIRYNQSAEEKYVANTSILNSNQTYKVEDLIESNLVFLDVRDLDEWGTLEFIPVEILTTEMDRRVHGSVELPQYSIEFRPSFEKITRR